MRWSNIGGVIGSRWNNSPCEIEWENFNWCQNKRTCHMIWKASCQMSEVLKVNRTKSECQLISDDLLSHDVTAQAKQPSLYRENGRKRFVLCLPVCGCVRNSPSCTLATCLWHSHSLSVWWQVAYNCVDGTEEVGCDIHYPTGDEQWPTRTSLEPSTTTSTIDQEEFSNAK